MNVLYRSILQYVERVARAGFTGTGLFRGLVRLCGFAGDTVWHEVHVAEVDKLDPVTCEHVSDYPVCDAGTHRPQREGPMRVGACGDGTPVVSVTLGEDGVGGVAEGKDSGCHLAVISFDLSIGLTKPEDVAEGVDCAGRVADLNKTQQEELLFCLAKWGEKAKDDAVAVLCRDVLEGEVSQCDEVGVEFVKEGV